MIGSDLLDATTLPRLLTRTGLRPGDRVLDVGCGDGSLVDALCAAGYDAIGLDDRAALSPKTVAGTPAASVPAEGRSVSLAIVRGTSAFAESPSSIEPLVGFANIVAAMRPGAAVAIVVPNWSIDDAVVLADRFGLTCEPTSLGEPIGLIGRLLGRRSAAGPSVPLAIVPQSPLSKLELHATARDAAMTPLRRAA